MKKEGSVYLDRFNQPKAHPAAARVDAENLDVATFVKGVGNLFGSSHEPFAASGGYLTVPTRRISALQTACISDDEVSVGIFPGAGRRGL